MFTAIVLDSDAQNLCIEKAIALGILPIGHPAKCHHVTLAMGNKHAAFRIGESRVVTVTHTGKIDGRVCAFRVDGAGDSLNATPHVTVAVFGAAKPRESNDITEWTRLVEPFDIWGHVKICE